MSKKYPLHKIADVIRGVTFSKAEGSNVSSSDRLPIIRAGSIQQSLLLDEGQIWVPTEKVKEHQLIKKNDIIMCTSSGSAQLVGKCAKSTQDWNGSFGAFCAGIRANEFKCDSSFLYHFLCSPYFRNWTATSSGANIKNIRASELAGFEIPLPPLPEQKRIASILDKADAIRRKRQQAIDLADEFLRSVFLDMFGDPVTNPMRWEMQALSNFAHITTGNTPSRKESDNYGSHIEWIKSGNINTPNHFLTMAEEYLSEKGLGKARSVTKGSVLITCIAGSKDCIGNAAIAERVVSFNQQINALSPKQTSTTEYLYSITLFGKKLIQSISSNSMKGMVSKGNLEKLNIPAPPIEKQKIYSERFNQYLQNRKKLDQALLESEYLFESTRQSAFSGKL